MLLMKQESLTKIGWNFGKCPDPHEGGYNMLNDPVFIFGTGVGMKIEDLIYWKNYGCNKSVAGQITVRGDVYLPPLEFTIGPYGSYTSGPTVYFDFFNESMDPNIFPVVHYYTHFKDEFVTLPPATFDPSSKRVVPSQTRLRISDDHHHGSSLSTRWCR